MRGARSPGWPLQGYERIGILGTSLGSCLAMLTTAHEPRIRAQALNHVSPWFADVVWRGLSTRHVREGLDGHIDLDRLRDLWRPISPFSYLDRVRHAQTLLVYARYDLTFPVDLSRTLVEEFRERGPAARGGRAAVRPLQHGHGAVQVPRRLRADAVSAQESCKAESRSGRVPRSDRSTRRRAASAARRGRAARALGRWPDSRRRPASPCARDRCIARPHARRRRAWIALTRGTNSSKYGVRQAEERELRHRTRHLLSGLEPARVPARERRLRQRHLLVRSAVADLRIASSSAKRIARWRRPSPRCGRSPAVKTARCRGASRSPCARRRCSPSPRAASD